MRKSLYLSAVMLLSLASCQIVVGCCEVDESTTTHSGASATASTSGGGAPCSAECLSWPPYAAQGKPCELDSDCPPHNPCMPSSCTADGICASSPAGDGLPGACPGGMWCTVDGDTASCCPELPPCIYLGAQVACEPGKCPDGYECTADQLCCAR